MKAASSFSKKINEFRHDTSGSVFTIAALMLFAIIVSSGIAIDYTRMVGKKSKMDSALDAAVLAAGVEMTKGVTDQGQIRQVFENFFYANVQNSGDIGSINNSNIQVSSFSADPQTGRVSAEVTSSINATLMQVAGYSTLDITSSASSVFDQKDVEVTMMLDVTGSMRGQRIADLKVAARDAVDILLPSASTQGVRIGLVPYASSVNAGSFASTVTSGNNTQVARLGGFVTSNNVLTNNCVSGRGGRDATTDAYYFGAPLGSDSRTVNGALQPVRRKCPIATVQPLTNDRAELKRQIGKYVADGYTAGHLGIAWSYYLLSENWRDLFNNANKPASYGDDVQKIAILMTDGKFNTAYEGISGTGNNAPFNTPSSTDVSNSRATKLCEDMKQTKAGNTGIIIYAVAFQAPASAQATLRACANADTADTTYYYSASSGQELRAAFRAIAASISNLRISG
ncbi:MAG: pilus assembly protein [Rhizobiaceae bacterium]|nr:pilus assembly protein [Rhizobiaceae bacterium]